MSEEIKLDFFLACAEEQDYQAPCEHVYDNNFSHIPAQAYAQFYSERRHREWYEEFTKNKFLYFCLLIKDAPSANRKFKKTLADQSEKWISIFEHWQNQADKERIAYIYRITQLPEDIVKSSWYNNSPEFQEWSKLCVDKLNASSIQGFNTESFHKSYQELTHRIQEDREISIEDEHTLSWVQRRVTKGLTFNTMPIVSHLCGEPLNSENVQYFNECFEFEEGTSEDIIYAPITQQVKEEISLSFLNMMAQGVLEEEYYLKEFLQIIKNRFHCELCDYLEVKNDGQRIELEATTVDFKTISNKYPDKTEEQLRQELSENQSYRIGEGISGSSLLCPQREHWFHVGSNNLAEDSRKSIWKQELYEVLYSDSLKAGGGKIRNFWLFPIFEEDKLMSAFRVVNKLNLQDELQSAGWPLFLRLQLCTIAEWFAKMWMPIKSLQTMRHLDLAATINEWKTLLDKFVEQFDLGWVSESFLSRVIEHLQSIVFRRIETRSLGCALIIIKEDNTEKFLTFLEGYPGKENVKISELLDAARYYDELDPNETAFVFDEKGKFIKVVRLKHSFTSDDEPPIAEITRFKNIIAFLVERERESILFYENAKIAAEYFLHRGIGKWKMRYFNATLSKICDAVSNIIDRSVIEQVYKRAWQLSYVQPGGGIIIGGDLSSYFDFEKEESTVNESVFNMGGDRFIDLAKQDGYVLLSRDGIVTKAGVVLRSKAQVTLTANLDTLIKSEQKKARHTVGAAVSSACRDALVIIVSMNRGITILYDGQPIEWNF